MRPVWSPDQDDLAAFGEAMADADVSLNFLRSEMDKLENVVRRLYNASRPGSRDSAYGAALRQIRHVSASLETPKLAQWRQQHSEGRGKRHSQQHILECKLVVARELLAERDVDFDAECASRRFGS